MTKNLFTYLIPAGLLTFLLLLFTNGYPIFTNIVLYDTPNCYTKVGYLKAVITNYNIITITNYTSKNKNDMNNMNENATTSSHIHITKKKNIARPMNNINDINDINNKHISVPVSKNNDNTNDTRNVNVSIVYNGEITLMYKTFPHCVFYCKMIVISMQPKESFIINYININYPVNSVVDAYCNSKGCVYDNFNCNVFTIKDEL